VEGDGGDQVCGTYPEIFSKDQEGSLSVLGTGI
jgi:hypothetical protein